MSKSKFIIILSLILSFCGSFFISDNQANANNLKDDKALEKVFKAASEIAKADPDGRGCETIPYADLQSDCIEQGKIREKYCKKGVLLECGTLKNPLTQAEIKKDKRKVTEIRNTGLTRQEIADSCLNARIEVQVIFKRALGKVERDKTTFAGKRSSAKNQEMKDFYTDMIEYCDNLLAYYNKNKRGHETQIDQVRSIFMNVKLT